MAYLLIEAGKHLYSMIPLGQSQQMTIRQERSYQNPLGLREHHMRRKDRL